MKIGDTIAVQIEGTNVAEAYVEDIDDGNATLIIPATRLVVKMRSTLDLAATNQPEVDRVFAGLDESAAIGGSEAIDATNTSSPAEAPAEPPTGLPPEAVGEGIHNKTNFPGEME